MLLCTPLFCTFQSPLCESIKDIFVETTNKEGIIVSATSYGPHEEDVWKKLRLSTDPITTICSYDHEAEFTNGDVNLLCTQQKSGKMRNCYYYEKLFFMQSCEKLKWNRFLDSSCISLPKVGGGGSNTQTVPEVLYTQ